MLGNFQPGTVVFGATPVLIENTAGVPVRAYDKKGRPVWNMPAPRRHAIHFKSEFARRQYEADLAALDEKDPDFKKKMGDIERKAKHAVPVYMGLSCSTARRLKATMVYRQRRAVRQQVEQGVARRVGNALADRARKMMRAAFINESEKKTP